MRLKTLLLDIETSPHRAYVWGIFKQTIAVNQIEEPGYTLCWSAKWLDKPKVYFSSLYHDGKEKMLHDIHALLDEAEVIIHYNGSNFDIPTLNQEFLVSGLMPPSPSLQIDLLKTVRARFRLPSNSLNYLCRYLGVGEKTAHKGMELWTACMAGDKKAWAVMKEYNINDIKILEAAYNKIKPWVVSHPNHNLFISENDPVCPNCGSVSIQKRGLYHTNAYTYQRFCCNNCGAWSRGRKTLIPAEKAETILVGIR